MWLYSVFNLLWSSSRHQMTAPPSVFAATTINNTMSIKPVMPNYWTLINSNSRCVSIIKG